MKNKQKIHNEVELIIEKFGPKIKNSLKNTHFQEREDLEQEIKLKIIEKLTDFKVKEVPSFWEIINK
ncbi:putative FlaG/YvyC family protein [Cerasibacillus quisquiliarum]|uniref:Helix-turn-helix conjugative transposon-like domain-containing protein n=1 Tax=Cerasibacillus quisquiliarum TaxID=227865 RepID=A0A511V0C6_9BACI|nr:helix-turn-helix domain-containing protein [Cerasibacillus quisquiliarum]MBB5147506.1 putative FlaG/YvyC family protein [Cerasibacillus quisquiliarum]GEN32356.1 hypothetical protein CQU01_25940 [Cerasibacillus quisquiliarum]